jgi:hypothetical protein
MSDNQPSQTDRLTEVMLAELNAAYEQARLRLSGVNNLTMSIFRNLVLLNGGAIVSIFTIMGHDRNVISSTSKIEPAFGTFVLGLICTMLAMACAFFAQNIFFVNEDRFARRTAFQLAGLEPPEEFAITQLTLGNRIRTCAVSFALFAVACFIVGSYLALDAVAR